MLIARNERKYADAMYTLGLVEEDDFEDEGQQGEERADSRTDDRADALAAELALLQSRKEAMLHADSDDDDDDDAIDDPEVAATPVIEAAVAAPVATTAAKEEPTVLVARPRRAWEIAVAEPVVFDCLLAHQERVWEKHRVSPRLCVDAAPKTPRRPAYRRPPPPPQPSLFGDTTAGPMFVLNAVERGLADVAPYVFNYYSTKKSADQPIRRHDPYDALATTASPQVDIDVWDPHPASQSSDFDEAGFLEAQLTGLGECR